MWLQWLCTIIRSTKTLLICFLNFFFFIQHIFIFFINSNTLILCNSYGKNITKVLSNTSKTLTSSRRIQKYISFFLFCFSTFQGRDTMHSWPSCHHVGHFFHLSTICLLQAIFQHLPQYYIAFSVELLPQKETDGKQPWLAQDTASYLSILQKHMGPASSSQLSV